MEDLVNNGRSLDFSPMKWYHCRIKLQIIICIIKSTSNDVFIRVIKSKVNLGPSVSQYYFS